MFAKRQWSALALALAVCAAGCGKDDKKKDGTGAGGDTAGATGAAAKAGAAGSALAYLPIDADQVFNLSFGSIRDSALFKQFAPMIMKQAGSELSKMQEACGLDPITAIESITASVTGEGGSAGVVAVIKGIPKETMFKCGQALAERETAAGDKAEVKIDGNYAELITSKGSQWFVFVDDKTMLAGKDMTREQLAERAAGKGGIDTSKAFTDMMGKVDTKASIWFVSKAPKGGAPMDMNFQSIYGSVDLSDGLGVKAGLRMPSAEEATSAVEKLNGQMGALKGSMFGKYLASLKIDAAGPDVNISVKLSGAEIAELAKMAPMLMGMAGGGGGMDE